MSIMIKVSYESPQELAFVLELLHPFIKSCKVTKKQEGQYKRAYIKLNK
ncbi:hypothetical protein [Lactonifactor longoviformis]|nr:hypothetical protein [Lactonifactor longoviformis]MCB5711364.1 hypothetical protein [Lactonifactor longoviformis]MCB5715331.1 hypothetical protein [Lactonifactor longoviformis]